MSSIYKEVDNRLLAISEEPQLMIFEQEIKTINSDFHNLTFKERGYSVNDTADSIIDSKINAIGFFSGAGGLDIGAQLAGVKMISSLDFDKDSVSTMKANKYFNHTKHFLKDIRDVTASDYKEIIKTIIPKN